MRAARRSNRVLACLGIVYVVWGSAFVFTKIAVQNLPPALFAGVRFTTAGVLLALIARSFGGAHIPSRLTEWRHVAVAGFFMVFLSNGLNTWAMQYLRSNESALLNGTSAFWIAGLGVFGRRGHPLKGWAIPGLIVGFAGALLMLMPSGPLSSSPPLAQAGALAACAAWALGTLYYRSIETQLTSMMFMALQMLMGGLMLLTLGLARGETQPWPPSAPGLLALCYLTFLSSCLAYAAYGWLTMNASPSLISTYSYVNPAIAAFLGWLFLHEELSRVQLCGMAVILVGVVLLTRSGTTLTDAKTIAEPKSQ